MASFPPHEKPFAPIPVPQDFYPVPPNRGFRPDYHQVIATSYLAHTLFHPGPRRPRSEKRPIPEELKDERYFERRQRNNLAAKKSRDARKRREDQMAMKAQILEKENAILRAQVVTLREEAYSLKQLLLHKRTQQLQQRHLYVLHPHS
ncbi:unnamed protein product [Darwinula stevensoni]|uniref:BZIP domain-containing protein n=1 Tax=Darwinula stevensoni TaxID=69355 RepID=A0A7R8XCK1_9CRUS|nr:unnamed protein product [Darwinula stevensoni]CAG0887807.1 unnamed protein product [Darwinula stevensoni]